MNELRDLYQEVILDHCKRPRNFGKLEHAHVAHGSNPLCGDQLTVYLLLDGDVIRGVKFEGSGCAISTAAASMMTQALEGKTRAEAEHLFERYHDMVTGRGEEGDDFADLGKLAAFEGVQEFPVRVKCASLSWHTMKAALEDEETEVTTE
ncbi:MAG: Fe-S cluster assembly sulfur transfer protein SufU [Planctomycetota bacterium]